MIRPIQLSDIRVGILVGVTGCPSNTFYKVTKIEEPYAGKFMLHYKNPDKNYSSYFVVIGDYRGFSACGVLIKETAINLPKEAV